MGSGTKYHCSKCDKDYNILWGYGFSKFKPYHLYKCNKCDYWINDINIKKICPKCFSPMKNIKEDDELPNLKCPDCNSNLEATLWQIDWD